MTAFNAPPLRPGATSTASGNGGVIASVGNYRWTICALLFFATTINYIDRQVLGLLAPSLQKEIGWNEIQYANIVSWFTLAYAIGFIGVGRMMDRIGVRLGFSVAIITWSLAAMSTALAHTVTGFNYARFALGLGESGNFPGAIKTVAEWFPAKERAFAAGIFNAGSNVGAILTPIFVPMIVLAWGWRAAFVITGALGFLWLIVWLIVYREPEVHPKLSKAELAYIQQDGPVSESRSVPWLKLLRHKQTWAFIAGKTMTDGIWWFYLYWLPKFLDVRFGVKLDTVALPIIAIYVLADVGSVGGGWMSGFLIRRGFSHNSARKLTMLMAAVAIVPTMFASSMPSLWTTVAVVSVAAAAHQWWSCNLFTLASDMFPRYAVASVVGVGGFFGAIAGFLFQRATGVMLQSNGNNYTPIFLICGLAYVSALLVIQLLAPRLEPAPLESVA
ncbi:MAG: MFS transporter [Gemmatimonadaceae bacterium]